MGNERTTFEGFLKSCPNFADEPIRNWHVICDWYITTGLQPLPAPNHNRPDVICVTESDRRVGVELKSWINEEQIAKAKRQELFAESILRAIGPLPKNDTVNINQAILKGVPRRFNKRDSERLREELFNLIHQADNAWPNKAKWEQSSHDAADLAGFPTVRKYLARVEVVPHSTFGENAAAKKSRNVHWIRFPNRPTHFKIEDMLTPLKEILSVTTDNRYQDICKRVGLDEVFLLIHYDLRGFEYNTAISTPTWSFKDTEDYARKTIGDSCGHFNRVFLFNSVPGQEIVSQLH